MTTMPRPRAEVEREIKETLGLVPTFFNTMTDQTLDFEWQLFRRFELEEPIQTGGGNGLYLSVKVRQLIGLGIHSETKCEYCTLFHTELARLFGASEEEIQETVHYAKHTLGLSGYLNGIRADREVFGRELEEIGAHLGRSASIARAS